MILDGKSVLLIAPKYFNYEIEIKNALTKHGAIVDFFDERPSNKSIIKMLLRLNANILTNNIIDRYYNTILKHIRNSCYDYILMINIESIRRKHIIRIKDSQHNSKLILYMWDSFKNKKNSSKNIDLFDSVLTFDENDSNLNEKIIFRPLFYLDEYRSITKKDALYDVSFIGTIHSDRYEIVNKIKEQCNKMNLSMFCFFYSPSKIYFFIRRLFDKKLNKCKFNDVSFKPLSKQEIFEIIEKSKFIIDINHPKQQGLTMRVLEMIGAKKKILTTNKNIKKYDFFDSNNIKIIDRNEPVINKFLLDSRYIDLKEDIYNKYSINQWVLDVLFLN